MPTLKQLAGKPQQVTRPATGGTQNFVGSLRPFITSPVKNIDKTAGLVSDIQKSFGNIMGDQHQASEYAGAFVGTDNYTSFIKAKNKAEEAY